MPKEIPSVIFQCSVCEESFVDWEACYYHEEECQHKQDYTPAFAHVIVKDGVLYLWTLSRELYMQEGDHMVFVGSAGQGNIPREFDYLYNMMYDRENGKWIEDEMPF